MHRLPLRVRDAHTHAPTRSKSQIHDIQDPPHKHLAVLSVSDNPKDKDGAFAHFRKHCPDSLDLVNETPRVRSPTQLSMTTLSSIPDSATTRSTLSTTGSLSTVASPLSSAYTSDFQELLACSRPSSRILHRQKASIGTCSTFVNDEDDVSIASGFAGHLNKAPPQTIDIIAPEFRRKRLNGPLRLVPSVASENTMKICIS